MRLGIFAKTFSRPTLEGVLDAVRAHGVDCVQFNLACVGLPALPERIAPELSQQIGQALRSRGITMSAVSGTFNLIHPDAGQRRTLLDRLRVLAEACGAMGTNVITMCTGTRDPEDMWRAHPDNNSAEAWRDVVTSMRAALTMTAQTGVTLAFEPEPANVVDSAERAARLIEEIGSPRLKVVFDGVNLVHGRERQAMQPLLQRSLELLRPYTVIAHAKDLEDADALSSRDQRAPRIDYPAYLRLLIAAGFDGPLILHGVTESQAPEALKFLNRTLQEIHVAKAVVPECRC